MALSGFQHLTLDQRRFLFPLKEARISFSEIASRLGRHRSTVCRELGRNRFRAWQNPRGGRCGVSKFLPCCCAEVPSPRAF